MKGITLIALLVSSVVVNVSYADVFSAQPTSDKPVATSNPAPETAVDTKTAFLARYTVS